MTPSLKLSNYRTALCKRISERNDLLVIQGKFTELRSMIHGTSQKDGRISIG